MQDYNLYDKLVILNDIYSNPILSNSQQTQQIKEIKSTLYPHQQNLVNGMSVFREKMTRGIVHRNQALHSKIGIIGDPAGTGKTLSILAYLAAHGKTSPTVMSELVPQSSRFFYSHQLYNINDSSGANLVIVPHSLFNQWKSEIAMHTTLKYTAVETKRVLKGCDPAKSMINGTFVLTTSNCYKHVNEYAKLNGIHWNNIIIDEASAIYFNSNDPSLKFQFLWLVTNNWLPLIFRNPVISKPNLYHLKSRVNMHKDLESWLLDNKTAYYEGVLTSSSFFKEYITFSHPLRSLLVLRNSDDTILSSIHLPSIVQEVVKCKPHTTLNSLMHYCDKKRLTTPRRAQISTDSTGRLAITAEPVADTEVITQQNIGSIFQALSVEFTTLPAYIAEQPPQRHELVQRRVDDNECIICFDKTELTTIVDCCNSVYCGTCLLKSVLLNNKCPTCREVVTCNNMHCIDNTTHINTLKNKLEAIIDIINSEPNGKFIIYTTFDNIFYQIYNDFDNLGIKAERIESNLFAMLKTIKNFMEGTTRVLFVSNVEVIRGLSLTAASHLIFFHELPVYELKQVLIHSVQRIGKVEPLKVIHLNSELPI
jgi:hypothetical protein